MRWPRRRKPPAPSADAQAAVEQVHRALADAERLAEHVDEVQSRAHAVASRADEVRRANHFAEAVEVAMRRRVRHS